MCSYYRGKNTGTAVSYTHLVNGICNIGVTCFILISGYYGVQFKLKKLVKMECMMISYSLLEILLMYLVMPEQLQGAALLEQLVKSLLPFISRKYWFYSCYVCLMLLSGYIQKLIDALDVYKRQVKVWHTFIRCRLIFRKHQLL